MGQLSSDRKRLASAGFDSIVRIRRTPR